MPLAQYAWIILFCAERQSRRGFVGPPASAHEGVANAQEQRKQYMERQAGLTRLLHCITCHCSLIFAFLATINILYSQPVVIRRESEDTENLACSIIDAPAVEEGAVVAVGS
ncbi:hypothetical protein D3C73_1445610 [compost metagenome]